MSKELHALADKGKEVDSLKKSNDKSVKENSELLKELEEAEKILFKLKGIDDRATKSLEDISNCKENLKEQLTLYFERLSS